MGCHFFLFQATGGIAVDAPQRRTAPVITDSAPWTASLRVSAPLLAQHKAKDCRGTLSYGGSFIHLPHWHLNCQQETTAKRETILPGKGNARSLSQWSSEKRNQM
ncbi:uncharacterized protein LOC127683357 isoform X2 [Apodemus sylvaticus]|uniref:uncharacterized protein LOC127683357 isoform X2 n=1 Tax=Apodemus sylvaticus TaxID=10129 RepID=UPI002244E571|nr:uncharacterized protein LOC127683357 isoform X2 [Apodemus sylvaticus]